MLWTRLSRISTRYWRWSRTAVSSTRWERPLQYHTAHLSMNPAGKLCTALVVLLVLGQAPKLSARTLPQVKVAVVLDHTDEHVSLNHTGTSQASDFSLTLVPVHIKNSSFAEASGRFCTDILQNGTSVVVLHTQTPKLAHLFAALSSEFRIPVIGDTSQDPLQPQQVKPAFLLILLPFVKGYSEPGFQTRFMLALL